MLSRENMDKAVVALMVMAISWLFIQSVRVDPVVTAVEDLTKIMVKNQKLNLEQHDENAEQHLQISNMILQQNYRIISNESALLRVVDDCKENHISIEECRSKQ